jgi:hypothetical protein
MKCDNKRFVTEQNFESVKLRVGSDTVFIDNKNFKPIITTIICPCPRHKGM